jgi:xylose isomerase
VILGKKMSEHLPFAMAWWHNMCAAGTDMFGRDTMDKSFGAAEKGTMEHAKAKVDARFEFMKKLGIKYFCFHDVDIVPEADDIKETNRRLDEISDYILEKMEGTDIKCLWGTANMFSNPRFMNGAGSTNSADVYCFAAAQIKKALELTVKASRPFSSVNVSFMPAAHSHSAAHCSLSASVISPSRAMRTSVGWQKI